MIKYKNIQEYTSPQIKNCTVIGRCAMILGYQRTSFSVFPIRAAFYSFGMFVIARRFFATEAAAGLQQKAAESTTELQKLFSNQSATLMKVRGHHKLQMDTVVSKRGKQMKFDFTYGWPFRYYCVCDLGTETVTKEAMLKFEVLLVGWFCCRKVSKKWELTLTTECILVRLLMRGTLKSCMWFLFIQNCYPKWRKRSILVPFVRTR